MKSLEETQERRLFARARAIVEALDAASKRAPVTDLSVLDPLKFLADSRDLRPQFDAAYRGLRAMVLGDPLCKGPGCLDAARIKTDGVLLCPCCYQAQRSGAQL